MAKKSRTSKSRTSKSRAPWERPNPREQSGKASTHLAPAQKSAAKARARRAGRPYPNLVDNMYMASAAKKKKKKKATKRRTRKAPGNRAARKSKTTRKSSRESLGRYAAPEKDSRGGLTAAGRKAFARKEG